jgi:hypothetical protein
MRLPSAVDGVKRLSQQIALPLQLNNPEDSARIVVGNANAHVIEALREASSWPFLSAVLTGPARSGKSLLGRWASEQAIDVIDDADSADETELFHRWNAAQESGTPLLLIANVQPWVIALPDLRSRLGGSLQLEMGEPDDPMAEQLLHAFAEQSGLSLAAGATDYLVPRATRSFSGLEHLVKQINRISLERQAPATMSVWRAALEATQGPEQQRLI